MADPLPLQQPIRDGGIRTVNFFNGRLLTSKDMGREQQARREGIARIGQAVGHGVATGLKVRVRMAGDPANPSAQRPVATVTKGLAVNRNGQTLTLGNDTDVMLTEASHPDGAAVGCLFDDCAPAATDEFVHQFGQQLYMLTIAPAFSSEGRAPMNNSGEGLTKCNTDATVEAVQFRLIEVNRSRWNGADFNQPDKARNRLAYGFFGKRVLPGWAGQLATAEVEAPNRADINGADEVPLALIAFNQGFTPVFVDMWSVRRRVHQDDRDDAIAALSGSTRPVLGEAMFRQFHDHIEAMGQGGLTSLTGQFDWLPAAGILFNVSNERAQALFAGLTIAGPYHIDQAALEPIIRESMCSPAIDTHSDHAIWLYRVAESQMARPGTPSTNMLIFANRYLPYRGDGRFDLSHFGFSNYTLELETEA